MVTEPVVEVRAKVEDGAANVGYPCWATVEVRNPGDSGTVAIYRGLTGRPVRLVESPGATPVALERFVTSRTTPAPDHTLPVVDLGPGEIHRERILLTRHIVFVAPGTARLRFTVPFFPRDCPGIPPSLWERTMEAARTATVEVNVAVREREGEVCNRFLLHPMEAFVTERKSAPTGPVVAAPGSAAEVLFWLASELWMEEFRELAGWSDPAVRIFALEAVATVPGPSGLPLLQKAVRDEDESVAEAAIGLLTERAVSVSEEGCAFVVPRKGSRAARALAGHLTEFAHPRAEHWLEVLTLHPDPELARGAAGSLRWLRAREAGECPAGR